MLADIIYKITKISDIEDVNKQNYMEGINFINNLYNFIGKLKIVLPIDAVEFQPSFKGRFTCERFNIFGTEKENEMKYFIIESNVLLEDEEKKQRVSDMFTPICETIEFNMRTVKFILK